MESEDGKNRIVSYPDFRAVYFVWLSVLSAYLFEIRSYNQPSRPLSVTVLLFEFLGRDYLEVALGLEF